MLGHTLARVFAERFDTYATVREGRPGLTLPPERLVTGVSAENFDSVVRAVASVKPDVVVNCIGIVKQLDAAHDPVPPSRQCALPAPARRALRAADARLLHVSTDCVFSGRRGALHGGRRARSRRPLRPDEAARRGRGRRRGDRPHLDRRPRARHDARAARVVPRAARRRVRGYTRAIFSGLTTEALARAARRRRRADHPACRGSGTSPRSRSPSTTCCAASRTRSTTSRDRARRPARDRPQPRRQPLRRGDRDRAAVVGRHARATLGGAVRAG